MLGICLSVKDTLWSFSIILVHFNLRSEDNLSEDPSLLYYIFNLQREHNLGQNSWSQMCPIFCSSTVYKLIPPLLLSSTELLGKIFHILYEDLEIVDESTFLEWRDRGTEQLGKGNAVHSLADFFQWLENANPESDTES